MLLDGQLRSKLSDDANGSVTDDMDSHDTMHNSEQTEARSAPLDGSKSSLQILMIEDDSYYYRFVRQLLKRARNPEFEVAHANNLAEASKLLSLETPDAILLDLHLPDGNGLINLARVKEVASGAPIIILTGSDDERRGLEAVGLGAQDYLIKQQIKDDSLIRCLLYSIERRKSEESILRLSTIRDFTAALAHDLQVPMIGSNNVFDAVLSGRFGELSPQLENVLSELNESNRKQLVLVKKLLEIYRYEVGPSDFERVEVDIKAVLSRCVFDSLERLGRSIPIAINLMDDMPVVLGDADSLYRLFCSLLDNAIRFCDGSEPIEVSAEVVGAKLTVQVRNSGPAIPDEVQTGLFGKFWQGVPGRSYAPNTGLGLYLCYRIVRLHHGRITCQSTEAEGTTITVRLPIGS